MWFNKVKAWYKEKPILKSIFSMSSQTFLALLVDFFGLLVGAIGAFTFIRYSGTHSNASAFILFLYVPILASDGSLGVLVTRVSTSLHLGTIKPQLLKNTEYFYSIVIAVIVLGLFNSLMIGITSYLSNLIILGENRILNPLPFFFIPICSLSFSALTTISIACLFAFFIYKKKLNPELWAYPSVSTFNNTLTTLLYALIIFIIQPNNWFSTDGRWEHITYPTYLLILPVLGYLGFVTWVFTKKIRNKDFLKTIKESIPVQAITLTIGVLTGGILSRADKALNSFRGLYVVYPAIMDTITDQTTILANTTITNVALGVIPTKYSSIKNKTVLINIGGIGLAGFIIHILYGILGSSIGGDANRMGLTILFSMIINLIVFTALSLTLLTVIVFSYKRKFDPGNYAVPIIAILSNFLTATLILLLTLIFRIV